MMKTEFKIMTSKIWHSNGTDLMRLRKMKVGTTRVRR